MTLSLVSHVQSLLCSCVVNPVRAVLPVLLFSPSQEQSATHHSALTLRLTEHEHQHHLIHPGQPADPVPSLLLVLRIYSDIH